MKHRKPRIAWSVAWVAVAVFVMVMLPPRNYLPEYGSLDAAFPQDGFHWPTSDELVAGSWGPVWPFVFQHALASLLTSALLAALPWVRGRYNLRATLSGVREHKARTVWSVAWCGLAVLLCVGWYRDWPSLVIGHFPGVAAFDITNDCHLWQSPWGDTISATVEFGWAPKADAKWQVGGPRGWSGPPPKEFSFQLFPGRTGFRSRAPHWFFLSLFAGMSAAPWILPVLPKRFSLRTLLIATTLIAVLLGIIVWAGR